MTTIKTAALVTTIKTAALVTTLVPYAPALQRPAQASPADSALVFPRVEGTNLEGRRFLLPADFEGNFNVVLVAFRREQQADVDTWVPFLKATTMKHAGLRVYELPTLARSYRIVRRFIDGGMARGIPEKATRETTITLYLDKAPFKKALGISAEDRIVTLLVSRDGRVLWRVDGRHTPEAAANLAMQIDALALAAPGER